MMCSLFRQFQQTVRWSTSGNRPKSKKWWPD